MKGGQIFLLVLNIGATLSLNLIPFEVRLVSNSSLQESPGTRIYGETQASEGQFPFMIFVLMNVYGVLNQCSAGLVKPNWVLLAAHCVYFDGLQPENIVLTGGKADVRNYVSWKIRNFHTPANEKVFNLQERIAKRFIYHPEFDPNTLHNDIALIQVEKPFVLGSASLIPVSESKMKNKMNCLILGWGLTLGNKQTFKLNYAENKIVSTTKIGCLHKHSGPFICLKPDSRGICQGDSGSPLVCNDKVWGVASHLVSFDNEPDCGNSEEEYYTEIYQYIKWMNSVYSSGNLNSMIGMKNLLLCLFTSIWLYSR